MSLTTDPNRCLACGRISIVKFDGEYECFLCGTTIWSWIGAMKEIETLRDQRDVLAAALRKISVDRLDEMGEASTLTGLVLWVGQVSREAKDALREAGIDDNSAARTVTHDNSNTQPVAEDPPCSNGSGNAPSGQTPDVR